MPVNKRVVVYQDGNELMAVGPVYTDDAVTHLRDEIADHGLTDRGPLRLISRAEFRTQRRREASR